MPGMRSASRVRAVDVETVPPRGRTEISLGLARVIPPAECVCHPSVGYVRASTMREESSEMPARSADGAQFSVL